MYTIAVDSNNLNWTGFGDAVTTRYFLVQRTVTRHSPDHPGGMITARERGDPRHSAMMQFSDSGRGESRIHACAQ